MIQLTDKIFAVNPPRGVTKFTIIKYPRAGLYVMDAASKELNAWKCLLPPGDWEIIGLASAMDQPGQESKVPNPYAYTMGYIQGRKDEREAQQWIPVTQEPERGGWFIVRDPNSPFRNKVQIARYSKCNNMWFEDHNSDDSLHPDYYVHILPEPPVKEP